MGGAMAQTGGIPYMPLNCYLTSLEESVLKTLAAKQIGQYNPYRDLKYPVKPRNVTVEQLLAAGCHIGQHKSNCHPAMKPFITGTWENLDIINLDYTLAHLRRACAIVREVSFRHGRILLAGTRKGHKKILINAAERMGAYLIYKKWIPGTITNAHNVLYRGRLKEMPTPIRKYASKSVLEELATKPLWDKETVARFVWDHHSGQWIMSDDRVPDFKDWKGKFRAGRVSDQDRDRGKSSTKFGPDELVAERDPTAVESASVAAANDAHTNRDDVVKRIENRARDRGDLADWMAWAKFASIVQSVSDQYTDILTQPHQSFHSQLPALSVETVNHYIPDHKDDWYKRELEAENEEVRRRHLIADATGDRNPFEMFKMDVFLKQSGYRGRVRGEYIHHRVKNVATDGITAYQNVRVFRDGSALVNGRRVDRFGAPITQFSDGSYRTGGKVYDIDGMRYDAKKDALVFSDGSVLKFDGQGDERKLVVVIGSQVFDVTSTVVGSAEKREILEKAEDLLQQGSEPRIREHMPYVEEILGGATLDIKYEMIRSQPGNLVDDEDEDDKKGTEDQMVSGDEMFDIGDTVEARSLDELIENSSELPAWQKRTWGVTEPLQPAETPFDNMYASINPTVQPELVILLNPRENRMAIHEATNHQIPTIGIIDTDCDPRKVTYSIPANDDSLRSVEYIAGVLSRAGEEGMIHRTRYTEQLEFLKERAKFFLEESWKDLDSLGNGEDDNEAAQEARNSVIKKYKDWYNLDPENLNKNILRKLALQHIVMGQNEIKRLYADTTGWSMQEFLDQVKTSTQFPGTPTTVLEDMARIQMTKARHVWAEARDKVDQRSGRLYPDESPIDSQT